MVASTLYADCVHYSRLQWPSDLRTSRTASPHGFPRNEGDALKAELPNHRPGHPKRVDVSAATLLPDVLLHPKAPENADIFHVVATSATCGLLLFNVVVSEPEYTHAFAASWWMLRHVPGAFSQVSALRGTIPYERSDVDFVLKGGMHGNGLSALLSMDSFAYSELQNDTSAVPDDASLVKDDYSDYESLKDCIFVACLSAKSNHITIFALVPNAVMYPGCDVHSATIKLAFDQLSARVLTWLDAGGADDTETDDAQNYLTTDRPSETESKRSFRPLLCIGTQSSAVYFYELSFHTSPQNSISDSHNGGKTDVTSESYTEQNPNNPFQFRVRLVYHLDGNRGHPRLIRVPPCIVNGKRVIACSSGPYLLNLFEIERVPNPDFFSSDSRDKGSQKTDSLARERALIAESASAVAGQAVRQQLALSAKCDSEATAEYLNFLKKSFTPKRDSDVNPLATHSAAAATVLPEATPPGEEVHHNKDLAMHTLSQPSLRAEAATTAAQIQSFQQDEALKKQILAVSRDLQACTLSNRQLEQQIQQLQNQQKQINRNSTNSLSNRPAWNNRFAVKGSELDHMYA